MKFDLDRYLALVEPLDETGIDYEAFSEHRLDDASLRCVRYMHDVEFHTTCYLRDLLVTSAHADPEITAFLTMWSFEEFWHGAALAKVLAHHDEDNGVERVAMVRRRVGRERAKTLSMAMMSWASDHTTTAALTWGAVNEWTTQAGYVRLAAHADHPVLSLLLHRIARQEGRHIDFYACQAERRLAASGSARRITRRVLQARWRPVGSGVMDSADTRHVVHTLFDGPEGRAMADRVDRCIGRLPGLHDLHLVRRSRERFVASA